MSEVVKNRVDELLDGLKTPDMRILVEGLLTSYSELISQTNDSVFLIENYKLATHTLQLLFESSLHPEKDEDIRVLNRFLFETMSARLKEINKNNPAYQLVPQQRNVAQQVSSAVGSVSPVVSPPPASTLSKEAPTLGAPIPSPMRPSRAGTLSPMQSPVVPPETPDRPESVQQNSRKGLYALLGVGVLAASGAGVYLNSARSPAHPVGTASASASVAPVKSTKSQVPQPKSTVPVVPPSAPMVPSAVAAPVSSEANDQDSIESIKSPDKLLALLEQNNLLAPDVPFPRGKDIEILYLEEVTMVGGVKETKWIPVKSGKNQLAHEGVIAIRFAKSEYFSLLEHPGVKPDIVYAPGRTYKEGTDRQKATSADLLYPSKELTHSPYFYYFFNERDGGHVVAGIGFRDPNGSKGYAKTADFVLPMKKREVNKK